LSARRGAGLVGYRRPLGWVRIAGFAAGLALALALLATHAWHQWPTRRYAAVLPVMDSGNDEAVYYASLGFGGNVRYEPEEAVLRGHLALRSGRPSEALRELEAATECQRTHWRAMVLSGAAYFNLRRLPEATRAWKAALAEDADNADLHRGLAAAYFDLGAMGPSQHHLERWIELSPNDPRPHRMMATIYKDFTRLPQASEHYRTTLRLIADDPRLAQFVPDLPQVHLELATCLADQGEFNEALEVLSDSESTAEVLTVRAECHFAEGQYDEADEEVRGALEQVPGYLPALLLAADVALDQQQVEEALQFAQRAVSTYPKDSSARQRLGLVYQRLGRLQEAEAELRKMELLRELRLRFTDLHARAGASPNDADVRYELGLVAHELALDDLALEWFSAALSIDPNHQDAYRARAQLLAPHGAAEESQTHEHRQSKTHVP